MPRWITASHPSRGTHLLPHKKEDPFQQQAVRAPEDREVVIPGTQKSNRETGGWLAGTNQQQLPPLTANSPFQGQLIDPKTKRHKVFVWVSGLGSMYFVFDVFKYIFLMFCIVNTSLNMSIVFVCILNTCLLYLKNQILLNTWQIHIHKIILNNISVCQKKTINAFIYIVQNICTNCLRLYSLVLFVYLLFDFVYFVID